MTATTLAPVTMRPIAAALTALRPVGTAEGLGRYFLHWDGVSAYAEHSPWSMSGFGDRIEFSFVADDPGAANQDLWRGAENGGFLICRIYSSDGLLSIVYSRKSDDTTVVLSGPPVVAGVVYSGHVSLNADGVELVINGTAYTRADTPKISTSQLTHPVSASNPFPGTIHYLRYVNATALQGVNAVMGNGVDLYGKIPEITLTGDFEIEFWWRRQDNTGSDFCVLHSKDDNVNRVFVSDTGNAAPNQFRVLHVTEHNINGAFDDVALGQDCHIKWGITGTSLWLEVDGDNKGSVTVPSASFSVGFVGGGSSRLMPANSTIQNIKITDKTKGVTYGPELVVNGGFDTDTTGWVSDDATLTVEAGELKITSTGDYGRAVYTLSGLEVGKRYEASCDFTKLGGINGAFQVSGQSTGGGAPVDGGSVSAPPSGPVSFQFIAGATTRYLVCQNNSPTLGAESLWDNVSVTEVTSFETYQYDLSGDDGDVITNVDPVTGVLGDELVTNGTFDTDLTGWTDSASADSVWVDGRLRIDSTAAWQWTWQNYTNPEAGKIVTVSIDWESTGAPGFVQLQVGNAGGATAHIGQLNAIPTPGGDSGTLSFTYISTGVDTKSITLKRQATDGDVFFDNVTVRETPHGLWQNYDPGTDQVALPVLSRNYRMKDGPDALFLEDANHPAFPLAFDSDMSSVSWSKQGPVTDNGDGTYTLTAPGTGVVSFSIDIDIPEASVLNSLCIAETTAKRLTGLGIWTIYIEEWGVSYNGGTAVVVPVLDTLQEYRGFRHVINAASNRYRFLYRRQGAGDSADGDQLIINSLSLQHAPPASAVLYNVDSADWYKRVVYGPELVTNGGPFVDTTGYTSVVATLSVVDSALRVTKTNTNGQGRTTAPIVNGKTYLVTAKLKAKTTATATYFQGGTAAGGTDYFNKTVSVGETITAFFTATGTTLYINLYSALTTGEYEDWEFVSVKEITYV